jgi:hypothetical protein
MTRMTPQGPPFWRQALLGTVCLLGAAPLLLGAGRADRTGPAGRPSLQGSWKLNEDITSRMMEGLRQDDLPGGPRGGGGGGAGGPGPGGRPGSAPPPFRSPRDGGHRLRFEALDELTITQTATEVTLTDKEGHRRVLKTDGSKARDESLPEGPAQVRARWEKEELVVDVKPDKGPRRTEAYIVSNDRRHLYLTLTIAPDDRQPELKVRRAYDPASDPAADPPSRP